MCAARRVPASVHVFSNRLASVVLPGSHLIEDVAPTTEPCSSAESRQQGGSQQPVVLSGFRTHWHHRLCVWSHLPRQLFSRVKQSPMRPAVQWGDSPFPRRKSDQSKTRRGMVFHSANNTVVPFHWCSGGSCPPETSWAPETAAFFDVKHGPAWRATRVAPGPTLPLSALLWGLPPNSLRLTIDMDQSRPIRRPGTFLFNAHTTTTGRSGPAGRCRAAASSRSFLPAPSSLIVPPPSLPHVAPSPTAPIARFPYPSTVVCIRAVNTPLSDQALPPLLFEHNSAAAHMRIAKKKPHVLLHNARFSGKRFKEKLSAS